jgi:hypothetical protein
MTRLMLQHGLSVMVLVTIVGLSSQGFSEERGHEFRVRDATTAIKIARAALEQEFGKETLKRLRNFEATLEGDRWMVVGNPYVRGEIPHHGGSFDLVIAVKGGCVLDIRVEM